MRVLRLWAEARLRWKDVQMKSIVKIYKMMMDEINWMLLTDEKDLNKIQHHKDVMSAPEMQIRYIFKILLTDEEMTSMGFPDIDAQMGEATDGEQSQLSWEMQQSPGAQNQC